MNRHTHVVTALVAPAVLVTLFAGCAASPQAEPPLASGAASAQGAALSAQLASILRRNAQPVSGTHVNGWLAPEARSGKGIVYVASAGGSDNGAVELFKAGGETPIGQITDGVNAPNGIATDGAGNLYVANEGANTVTVYAAGALSPTTTYVDGINFPTGVAAGADGTVYVSNGFGSPSGLGTVTEYPKGSTSPSITLALTGYYAMGVALDSANNLYVSWWTAGSNAVVRIEEYAPGSTQGKNLGLQLPAAIFPAYTIAFDRSGNLVLSVEPLPHAQPKYLAVFPPGATKPSRKINLSSLLDTVVGFAFPADPKHIYVASENDNNMLLLTYPGFKVRDGATVGQATGLALAPGV